MATDRWPNKDGILFDEGTTLIPCYATDDITEGSCVKASTTQTNNVINVAASTAIGDGIGVATRATSTGKYCTVMFHGVYKMINSTTDPVLQMGSYVMNSLTTQVLSTIAAGHVSANDVRFQGASHVLGMVLQKASAILDEVAILVGRF